MTGSFLLQKYQTNVHIENITIDYAKFREFYDGRNIEWNYPEAYLTPTLYFNNITVVNSKPDEMGDQGGVLALFDQGNITVTNLDWTNYF